MTMSLKLLWALSITVLQVRWCECGCAEVDSMTEAVQGQDFMLGCISCKRREEVSGVATVDWHFKPPGADEFVHIFHYDYPNSTTMHADFESRLDWAGTKGTEDLQIGAVYLRNVSFNDSGTYQCTFERKLLLPVIEQEVTVTKTVELSVVPVANRELTAVISEVLMYVLIVGLQLWLIGVLIYCYKKIYAENEAREAKIAQRAKNKLIDKDSCDGGHLE